MRLAPVPISIRLKVSSLIFNRAVTERTYKNVRRRNKNNSFLNTLQDKYSRLEQALNYPKSSMKGRKLLYNMFYFYNRAMQPCR
jgi:hypothetical protein